MERNEQADRQSEGQLNRDLASRHIQLIALGGTIGTGLFLGSANAIRLAGPGLILSYVIGGVLIFFIMRALGELLLYRPVAGAFAQYAEEFISPFAGYVTGWSYWFMWIVTGMAQLSAIGIYVHYWLPSIPQWASALAALVLLYGANLVAVKTFGELEFWFALIKVATIVSLIVIGALIIAFDIGDLGRQASVSNLWSDRGFLPFGMTGVLLALQMAIYAYAGVEVVGVTAAEAKNPAEVMPRATSGIIWKILFLYIGAVIVLLSLVPWADVSPDSSPFVAVYERMGIANAGGVINAVVITAAASACASGLYSAGRMLYSLALDGNGPRRFAQLDRRHIPFTGISASALLMLIGVVLNYAVPGEVFLWLTSISLVGTLWTWIAIMLAHRGYRRAVASGQCAQVAYRMPGGAIVNWLVIAALIILAGSFWFDSGTRVALFVAPVWFGLLALSYRLLVRREDPVASRKP